MSIEIYVDNWNKFPTKQVRLVDIYDLPNEEFAGNLHDEVDGFYVIDQPIEVVHMPFLRSWISDLQDLTGEVLMSDEGGYWMGILPENLYVLAELMNRCPDSIHNLSPILATAIKHQKGVYITG